MLRNSVSKQVARWRRSIGAIRRSPTHLVPLRPVANSALGAVLAALSAVAAADSDSAQRHFQAGRRAYEAQHYQAALDEFDAALAAGMSGPAIHFNVGVTAYRLGRYERAHIEFSEVARTPTMAALAHYNLGLIELKRERTREARTWFSRAQNEAADEQLRELATTQLAQLSSVAAERNWAAFGSVGFGYDDNVALVSSDDVLGVSDRADGFAELGLAVRG
ncbi:MAG: tetratricopeptide repeat protein, partial [Steroidobacteraceae bacterium]